MLRTRIDQELLAARLELDTLLGFEKLPLKGDTRPVLNTEHKYILDIRDLLADELTEPRDAEDDELTKMLDAQADALTEKLFHDWSTYRDQLMKESGWSIPVLGEMDDTSFEQYVRMMATRSTSLYHIQRILFPGICTSLTGCVANPTPEQLDMARPYVVQLARRIARNPQWQAP